MVLPKNAPWWLKWCSENQLIVLGTLFGVSILVGITLYYFCERSGDALIAREYRNFQQVTGMSYDEFEERHKRAGERMDAVNAAREAARAEEEARKKARRDEERQAFQFMREMEREREWAKEQQAKKEREEELEKQKRDAEREDDDEPGPSNRFAPERERLVGGTSSDDETPSESDQESQEPLRTFETNGIRETEL